jgi:hypothetical protein
MIWGGRVTSVQICLLLAVTFFYRFITVKRTIISFFAGVISMTIVGFYRVSYSLDENYFENIFNYLKTNLFVLDTATYAYGASMTFLYSMQFAPFGDRFISFINNVMYILIGSSFNMSDILNKNTITQLSDFSKNFHIHNGGGVFPIFFYFWLGWPGCILSGIGVAKYLSYFSKQKDELGSLIFIALIITVPRWYLYNPITMFRGPLVFLPLVYFFIKIIEHILKK